MLKSFNIWNNMLDKMSYEGAYNIAPEIKWTVRFCYVLTDAKYFGKYYKILYGADFKVKKNLIRILKNIQFLNLEII